MFINNAFRGAVSALACPGQPEVELMAKIRRVCEASASFEVTVDEAMVSLKGTLGFSVPGSKDDPAETQIPR